MSLLSTELFFLSGLSGFVENYTVHEEGMLHGTD